MTAAATVPRRLFYCFRFPAAAVAACISSTEMQAATAAACLSFDGISRPSTTATVFPLTAVCVRLARDQNLGLVGQGGRGAFQFMRQMTQSWNFRNIVRLFTLGAIHKVRSHSRGGGGQISRKFCSWV